MQRAAWAAVVLALLAGRTWAQVPTLTPRATNTPGATPTLKPTPCYEDIQPYFRTPGPAQQATPMPVASDVVARQQALIAALWKGGGIPIRTPDAIAGVSGVSDPVSAAWMSTFTCAQVSALALTPPCCCSGTCSAPLTNSCAVPNLASTHRYTVNVPNAAGTGPQFQSWMYFYLPATVTKNTLAVVTHGHTDVWDSDGIGDAVRYFVAQGYPTLLVPAPLYGGGLLETTPPVFSPTTHNNHDSMAQLEVGVTGCSPASATCYEPIRAFVEPQIIAMQSIIAQYGYSTEVMVTGVSGGAWSSLLWAAFDPRVRWSYPVSGSELDNWHHLSNGVTSNPCVPPRGAPGDWEIEGSFQSDVPSFPNHIMDLVPPLDQYLMAGWSGSGTRQQIQMNSRYDTIYIGIDWYVYQNFASAREYALGGHWRFFSDALSHAHQISPHHRQFMREDMEGVIQTLDDTEVGFYSNGTFQARPTSGRGFEFTTTEAPAGATGSFASWTFTVPPGLYDAWVTYPAAVGQTTAAIFVTTGDGPTTTVVNQVSAPSGLSAFGFQWTKIASSLLVSGTTLTVFVTDSLLGRVVADAVRVQQVGPVPGATATPTPVIGTPTPNSTRTPFSCPGGPG